MEKRKGYGNISLTQYFVSETEFSNIETVLENEELVPGDECWVEDTINSVMLSAHVYSGTGWRKYLTFSV